ncbi:MAG: hypothetical protein Q8K56_00090, partial [Rhodoglobus sp.]|nr:hypothetical protein [Rhodoglobus sp.]
ALIGYFSVYTIPAGVLVGAVVALAFDRRSRTRTTAVTAERSVVEPAAVGPVETGDPLAPGTPAE